MGETQRRGLSAAYRVNSGHHHTDSGFHSAVYAQLSCSFFYTGAPMSEHSKDFTTPGTDALITQFQYPHTH